MSVADLTSLAEFQTLQSDAAKSGKTVVLLFTSAWHPPCKQMRVVCDTLAHDHPGVLFASVDAESVSDVTELFESVESVPTTIIIKGGKNVATLAGANAVELGALVATHARPIAVATSGSGSTSASAPAVVETKEELDQRLGKLVNAAPVMAFIKGTPDAPRCGFTRQLLALLKEHQIEFGSFDILADSTVREGLKAFSNWPTYPQLYISGELVGGLDVVKELASSGELVDMVPAGHVAPKPTTADLNTRLKELVSQRRVMLFMKGSPANPQCGFSSKAVAMLADAGLDADAYGSFDIFSDQEVREGLKEYSNWPTYPQLYVNGELVGGLDVMQELKDAGELASTLDAPPELEA